MRDLDECTAEVFRRSEKRIRDRRRNRNLVLALCIPACLIVTVWSAMSLPAMLPAMETSDSAQLAGEAIGDAEMNSTCPYIEVEIRDANPIPEEHHNRMTDTAAVAEMFHTIQSLFADAEGDGHANGESFTAEEEPAANDLTDAANKQTNHVIIFTAEDGSRAVYHLMDHSLVDVSTHETVFLSDAQMAELLADLGISE